MSTFVARRIIKIGNSIGVTLPKEKLRPLGFLVGDIVAITPHEKTLVISRLTTGGKGVQR